MLREGLDHLVTPALRETKEIEDRSGAPDLRVTVELREPRVTSVPKEDPDLVDSRDPRDHRAKLFSMSLDLMGRISDPSLAFFLLVTRDPVLDTLK